MFCLFCLSGVEVNTVLSREFTFPSKSGISPTDGDNCNFAVISGVYKEREVSFAEL